MAKDGLIKAGSQSFFDISHGNVGAVGFGPCSASFPYHLQEAGLEVEYLEHEPLAIWVAGTKGLVCCANALVPKILIFFINKPQPGKAQATLEKCSSLCVKAFARISYDLYED